MEKKSHSNCDLFGDQKKNKVVVNLYPTISTQELKRTQKQTRRQTQRFIKLNRFMWEKREKK